MKSIQRKYFAGFVILNIFYCGYGNAQTIITTQSLLKEMTSFEAVAPDNTSSFKHNTFTRTRNSDGIPFTSSFKYNLEMLSWDGGTVNAAATTYWYGDLGETDNLQQLR